MASDKIGGASLDRPPYSAVAPTPHDDKVRFQLLSQTHDLFAHYSHPEVGSGHSPATNFHPPGQLPEHLPGLLLHLLVEQSVKTYGAGAVGQEVR